ASSHAGGAWIRSAAVALKAPLPLLLSAQTVARALAPAEVGFTRLQPLQMPNSGKPEFGCGERAQDSTNNFVRVRGATSCPSPQPSPRSAGRGSAPRLSHACGSRCQAQP